MVTPQHSSPIYYYILFFEKLLSDSMYDGAFISTNAGYVKYSSLDSNNARFQGNFVRPPHFEMAAANSGATISVSTPQVDEGRHIDTPVYFTVSAAVKVGAEKVMTAGKVNSR